MKEHTQETIISQLDQLCITVKALVAEGSVELCIPQIAQIMAQYPHAPHPHNLLGIVMEKTGDHISAMKHFRAALALDPTYLPATYNLETYGTFHSRGKCYFDESDVHPQKSNHSEIVYDDKGIGRVVSKNRIAYNEYGIGRIVRR